jgi:hypothetical protein
MTGRPDFLFGSARESSHTVSPDFRCTTLDDITANRLTDVHTRESARICSLRVLAADDRQAITLSSEGLVTRSLSSAEFGTLVSLTHAETEYTLWIPGAQAQFHFDARGRIEVRGRPDLSCQWMLRSQIELTHVQNGLPEL